MGNSAFSFRAWRFKWFLLSMQEDKGFEATLARGGIAKRNSGSRGL